MSASGRRFSILVFALASAWTTAVLSQTSAAVRVTAARANVRSEPNEKGAVVSQVTSGTVLQLKSVEGDWYHVELQVGAMRVDAYISKKVAAPVTAGASVGAKPGATAAAASRPAAAVPTMKDGMSVAMTANGGSVWLAPGTAKVVRIPERADSLRAAAVAIPVGPPAAPPSGSGRITYVWTIDQTVRSRAIANAGSGFAVTFKDVPARVPTTSRRRSFAWSAPRRASRSPRP